MIGIGTPNSQSKIPRPINHHLIATLRCGRLCLPNDPVCTLSYANGVGWRLGRSREQMPDATRPAALAKVSRMYSTFEVRRMMVHHEIYDACP